MIVLQKQGGQAGEATVGAFKLRAGLTILALAGIVSAPCLAQALLRAERPDVKVGDSTVFRELDVGTGEKRDTAFVVTAVDADKIVNEASGATSGARTFTRDFNPVEIRTGEVVTAAYKPFLPHLQFPLEVGRKWDIPYEVEVMARAGNRSAKWQWHARVVAAEAVTVPAGTFQSLRIEYDGSFNTRQGNQSYSGTHKETAWFAPELQRIVKRDLEQAVPSRNFLDHRVIELVSFKPAP
jgi:hypothetical protein